MGESSEPSPASGAVTTADLAHGDAALQSPSPSRPPSVLPKASLSDRGPVRAPSASTPSRLDALLVRLHRCMSTPSGIDTTLLFVCYTSRLAASLLLMLPGGVSRGAAPRRTAPAALTLTLATRLDSLSALLGEARVMLRLWGLLAVYTWARDVVAVRRDTAPAKAVVAWLQLAACVLLQGLENGAYLASKRVLGWTPATQAWAYRWSSRFWALHVGLDLGRLATEAVGASGGSQESLSLPETDAWRKQFASNLAWAPLTLHWGTDRGLVSEWAVGLLGCIPGIIQMRDLWASTAS